ncbi:MAG TPA: DUF1015 domain-containing protein [Desulfomonilia bacterium]|nr:DUF1015 domain-containing protein [Desulfomonilia bacterium]
MPKIRSFRGIRYNPERVDIAHAVCPPYDIIPPHQVEEYYNKSSNNAVRLVLGKQFPKDNKDNNRYTRARDLFKQWIKEEILIQDKNPAIYYHEQTFTIGDKALTRRGFIASVRLDEDDKKSIRPHEHTVKSPKLDRLRLMSEVRTNFSSVLGVYSDPKKTIETQIKAKLGSPQIDFSTKDETHKLWIIDDSATIEKISKMMNNKKILIADGQHRYETAKIYRDRMKAATSKTDGNQNFDYIQMYLVNIDEGIKILPLHRVITDSMGVGLVDLEYRIKEIFNMAPYDNRKTFLAALNKSGKGSIGLYVKGIPRFYLLQLSNDAEIEKYLPSGIHPLLKKQDVTILHECIIEPILGIGTNMENKRVMFTSKAEEALDMVAKEEADIAFLLNPPTIEDVMEIAETGLRMPHNSTFFYPKTPTGLVFHTLE